jgi:exopolyphosphatase/guanosine-5'-triphosphate,3'-diphosphate pyrophosphatase
MIGDVRVGILDVGSNTTRLLVADVRATRLVSVTTGRAHLGLGAEIADTGTLRRKTIAAAARVCRKYADRARELGVERAQVIVTAPGRQGAASAALVAALREATHLPVRILAADDEGRLAFEGAIVALGGEQPSRVGVVDVGGGSTEIVVGAPGAGPAWLRSLDLGSLRLTRLSLPSDPPTGLELARARSAARTAFAPLDPPRPVVALATGGSARALARLVGGIYDHDDAAAAVAILARRRSGKVAREVGIDPSRAGTLLAGALLLGEASRTLGRPLRLARGGLREGAALALAAEPVARAA